MILLQFAHQRDAFLGLTSESKKRRGISRKADPFTQLSWGALRTGISRRCMNVCAAAMVISRAASLTLAMAPSVDDG
jgi:hypothetical protein